MIVFNQSFKYVKKYPSMLFLILGVLVLLGKSIFFDKVESYPVYRGEVKPIVLHKLKNAKKNFTSITVPKNLKENQIASFISKEQLKKNNYFMALASKTEGFKYKLYKDNRGYALGHGWNLTEQSPKTNKKFASAVFKTESVINTITNMSKHSSKMVSVNDMKQIRIKPEQAQKVTYLMGQHFKKEVVIPGIAKFVKTKYRLSNNRAQEMSWKVFNNLKPNEQDAIIYHAYKCGFGGFTKFQTLLDKLVDYSLGKNKVKNLDVVKEFNYSYKIGNKKYLDKNAENLVGAMFSDPKKFVIAMK